MFNKQLFGASFGLINRVVSWFNEVHGDYGSTVVDLEAEVAPDEAMEVSEARVQAVEEAWLTTGPRRRKRSWMAQ